MTSHNSSPWHILGAGAIGSLWANYLLRHPHPVTLLCRTPAKLDALWDDPFLTLVVDGQRFKTRVNSELVSGEAPIERLLVTTKSYDSEAALASISHRLHSDTLIVILQNGMGAQQAIAARFPDSPVYAAITTEGAYRTGPHQVVHAGHGETWLGPLNSAARQQDTAALAPLLELPLTSHYATDIETRLWQKLAINCAINGLTALHDCRNGALLEPPYRQQMARLCEEFERVTEQMGLHLFDGPLLAAAERVAEATADNLSSMLQDVRHQRRTEIDFINGYLCRQAERLGIEVPAHRQLVEQINALGKPQPPAAGLQPR